MSSMGKKERAEAKAEREREQQAQKAAAFRARDKALEEMYLKYGCRVLKRDGKWAEETVEQAEAWGEQNKVRWELLGKGDHFRTLPEGMGEEEALVAVRKEQITLVRQIRAAVKEAAEKERRAR